MTPTLADYRAEIEAALVYAGGSHVFEDVVAGVERGDMQFWPGPHSVIITEIADTPQQRVLHFFLAAGVMAEIEAMYDGILTWGRERGCVKATMIGRRGWERSFITRRGWAPTATVYDVDLNRGQEQ